MGKYKKYQLTVYSQIWEQNYSHRDSNITGACLPQNLLYICILKCNNNMYNKYYISIISTLLLFTLHLTIAIITNNIILLTSYDFVRITVYKYLITNKLTFLCTFCYNIIKQNLLIRVSNINYNCLFKCRPIVLV